MDEEELEEQEGKVVTPLPPDRTHSVKGIVTPKPPSQFDREQHQRLSDLPKELKEDA